MLGTLTKLDRKVLNVSVLVTVALSALLIFNKHANRWFAIHVAGEKGVKVLFNDTLWDATLLTDSFALRYDRAQELAQSSDDYPYFGNTDTLLRWAYKHECRYFVQYRNDHVAIYYRYVLRGLPFAVITSKNDTDWYRPRMDGWANIVGDPGAKIDNKGNIHLADIDLAWSESSDSAELCDSCILKRIRSYYNYQ